MSGRLLARSLAVAAGGRVLARGIDLDVGPAARVALTGPSGSGKTTLLRVLAGLVDPAEGTVSLDGEPAGAQGWPAYRRRVVHVGQQPALREVTVQEVLARPFRFRAVARAFPEDRARSLLHQLQLEPEVWTQRATTLSGGQQQRVTLVRALLLDPDVLLLDEPTSGLDVASSASVEEALAEFPGGVLIASHDLGWTERLATSAVDLEDFLVSRPAAGVAP